jgi:hypothetical protein
MKLVVRLILGHSLRNLESWVEETICDETSCKVDFGLFLKRFRKLGRRDHSRIKLVQPKKMSFPKVVWTNEPINHQRVRYTKHQ